MNLEEIKKALPEGCRIQQAVHDHIVITGPSGQREAIVNALQRKFIVLAPGLAQLAEEKNVFNGEVEVLATQPIPTDFVLELPPQAALGDWEPPVATSANVHGRAARRDANRNRFRSRK